VEESSGHRLNIAAPWTGGDFLAVASHLFGSADVSLKGLVRLLSYNKTLGSAPMRPLRKLNDYTKKFPTYVGVARLVDRERLKRGQKLSYEHA
jgi:hypothetical protein